MASPLGTAVAWPRIMLVRRRQAGEGYDASAAPLAVVCGIWYGILYCMVYYIIWYGVVYYMVYGTVWFLGRAVQCTLCCSV